MEIYNYLSITTIYNIKMIILFLNFISVFKIKRVNYFKNGS